MKGLASGLLTVIPFSSVTVRCGTQKGATVSGLRISTDSSGWSKSVSKPISTQPTVTGLGQASVRLGAGSSGRATHALGCDVGRAYRCIVFNRLENEPQLIAYLDDISGDTGRGLFDSEEP